MIEVIGIISTALAVAGVVLNNRRLRLCFVLWVFSNAMCFYVHVRADVWSLAGRDIVFIVLAVEGWFRWGR